jgi:hypothetical protein
MSPENLPYHFSALASIVADVWVGILSLAVWNKKKIRGFLVLAIACAMFLVGSVYGYFAGLTEYGILQWPLDALDTYRVYLTTSFPLDRKFSS